MEKLKVQVMTGQSAGCPEWLLMTQNPGGGHGERWRSCDTCNPSQCLWRWGLESRSLVVIPAHWLISYMSQEVTKLLYASVSHLSSGKVLVPALSVTGKIKWRELCKSRHDYWIKTVHELSFKGGAWGATVGGSGLSDLCDTARREKGLRIFIKAG